ncbi:MAG: F0F1 ATP synthase subunit alpha [Clostridiaceae bacterium]|nr:F0F1 ATP synthase subunit alpha [Clostridiaceae bacterium]
MIRDDLLHKRGVRPWDAYRDLLPKESGTVLSIADGIAVVSGLPSCMFGEVVRFSGGQYGIAMNLERDSVGVVLVSGDRLKSGDDCFTMGATVRVPTGDAVVGRVLSPLGQPLDGGPDFPDSTPIRPIESPAPAILARQPVRISLETGITAIDAMVPIGRGQRELIIGDRQTGKTTIAIDAIINQKGKGVYCFYVAIGQKMSTIAQLHELFERTGALEYTTIVAASASDTAGVQYLAPYAGCAMAEAFMYEGKHCLVVYDDLTKHAQAYRAISLLLRRPPGREAFPGDVFYLHSRLLERAAQMSDEHGGGSMTALPIVETQAGDISAYVPTNIISITDGQIYLDTDIFIAGQRPAVNVGLSVSRVGGDAQSPAMREVAGPLRIALAQYREKKAFSQFATDLDDVTQRQLGKGDRLMLLLSQNPEQMRTLAKSLALLELGTGDVFRDIASADLPRLAKFFIDAIPDMDPELVATLETGKRISQQTRERIKTRWREFLDTLGTR